MITITSLIVSFFIVIAINRYRNEKSLKNITSTLSMIIAQMELHASLNPQGMKKSDYDALRVLIVSAQCLALKTCEITVIILAKKMSEEYDRLKVREANNVNDI